MEIGPVRPQEQEQLERLLSQSFPTAQGASFYDDFPVWNPMNGANLYRVRTVEEGKVVATAGVRFGLLKAPGGPLPIGIIGAVATDPDYRSRGLASKNTLAAIAEAERRKTALLLLWGSEHELYRRLGFELCGHQLHIPLQHLLPVIQHARKGEAKKLVSVPMVSAGWTDAIFDLRMKQTEGLQIGLRDRMWYASHKNVSWFYTGSPDAPRAYVAAGRGIDLQNMIHEWYGPIDEVLALLDHLNKTYRGLELLGSPAHFRTLGVPADQIKKTEFFCMARVLDPQAVATAFAGPEAVKVLPDLMEKKNWGPILFGPQSIDHKGFPLPLWLWGLDAA